MEKERETEKESIKPKYFNNINLKHITDSEKNKENLPTYQFPKILVFGGFNAKKTKNSNNK